MKIIFTNKNELLTEIRNMKNTQNFSGLKSFIIKDNGSVNHDNLDELFDLCEQVQEYCGEYDAGYLHEAASSQMSYADDEDEE